MNKNRTKTVSLALSVIIFVIIVIAAYVNKDAFGKTVREAETIWLIAGALCYCCNYFFRSYRLWLYANKSRPLFPVYLKITCLHGFNAYFLPMRSGDVTLPFLLRLHADIPLAPGSRILVRARMLDISSLGYLLFFSTLFTPFSVSFSLRLLLLGVGLSFVVIPYVAVYIVRKGRARMKSWLHRMVGEGKPSYPALRETLISLVIWFWIGCTMYCVIRSLDIPLSFYAVWFLVAVQLPLQMLPVQGLANSGNHELGWVLALNFFGVAPKDGLAMALASHVILISYAILLGIVAVFLSSGKVRVEKEISRTG